MPSLGGILGGLGKLVGGAINPLLGVASSLLPAVAQGGASALGAKYQMQESRKMAREQMAFEERMSSTAYQRATQDMKLAGINPMLAYMQGGASSPGGAMGEAENVAGAGAEGVASALALRADMRQKAKQMEVMEEEKKKLVQEGRRARIEGDLLDLQKPEAQAYGDFWKSPYGKARPFIDTTVSSARGIAEMIGRIRSPVSFPTFNQPRTSRSPMKPWGH